MILKSELKSKNRIAATGASAVPVITYSFGISDWTLEEVKNRKEK